MSRILSPQLRDAIRSAARGNPWRMLHPRVPAPIAPVVWPLRYDVVIRARLFDLCAEHRGDPDTFAARAATHPYRQWFEHVYIRTWRPQLSADPDGLEAEWNLRLSRATELYESFAARGFDPAHPVTLHAGAHVQARVRRDLYAGDGNHRIALLLAAGRTQLEPGEYRVKRFRTLHPADTTAGLAAVLGEDPYADPAFAALAT